MLRQSQQKRGDRSVWKKKKWWQTRSVWEEVEAGGGEWEDEKICIDTRRRWGKSLKKTSSFLAAGARELEGVNQRLGAQRDYSANEEKEERKQAGRKRKNWIERHDTNNQTLWHSSQIFWTFIAVPVTSACGIMLIQNKRSWMRQKKRKTLEAIGRCLYPFQSTQSHPTTVLSAAQQAGSIPDGDGDGENIWMYVYVGKCVKLMRVI